jgi:hypothetical protein
MTLKMLFLQAVKQITFNLKFEMVKHLKFIRLGNADGKICFAQ